MTPKTSIMRTDIAIPSSTSESPRSPAANLFHPLCLGPLSFGPLRFGAPSLVVLLTCGSHGSAAGEDDWRVDSLPGHDRVVSHGCGHLCVINQIYRAGGSRDATNRRGRSI